MTRPANRDVDRAELGDMWRRQADGLGFDAEALAADATTRSRDIPALDHGAGMDFVPERTDRQPDLCDPPPRSLADSATAWADRNRDSERQ